MTTAIKRKKLHELINAVDDIKVNAIFSIVDREVNNNSTFTRSEKIRLMRHAPTDPLFLKDLKEIADDFKAIDQESL